MPASSDFIPVRPATDKDVQAVAEVHLVSWLETFRPLVSEDYIRNIDMNKRVKYWKDAIQYGEPQVIVALDGKDVVGFVGYDRSRDPKTKPTTGEIWAIYVDPDYIGEGYGLALWDGVRDALIDEGCTEVTLWVPIKAERVLRFFDEAGFKREMTTAKTVDVGGARVEEIRLRRAL